MYQLLMSRKTLAGLTFIWLVWGCAGGNEKLYFSSMSDGWAQQEEVQFLFSPEKINHPTNMYIYLRNNDHYPFSNIHLITTLKNPIGETLIDTLSYSMATPDGEWIGQGYWIHENKLWYKEAYRFGVVGEYQLSIRPAMRRNEQAKSIEVLEGIKEVGIGIEQIQSEQ